MLSVSGLSPRPVPIYGMEKRASTFPYIGADTHTHKFVPSWVRGLGRTFGVQNTQKCRLSPSQQNEQKKTQKIYKRCERAEEGGGQIKKNNNKKKRKEEKKKKRKNPSG